MYGYCESRGLFALSVGKTPVVSNLKKDSDIWTYDRFVIGQVLGSSLETIKLETLEKWWKIFGPGDSSRRVSSGLAQLIIMRVYTEVVQPRPPGNLHVGQMVYTKVLPPVDQVMIGEVFCLDKRLKVDKKLIIFQVDVSDPKSLELLFQGKVTVFWSK